MKNNPLLKKLNLRYLVSLLISIVLAFIIGAGILALSGFSPLKAYGAMLSGAFDSARHVGDFLEYAMVLCICGLACVLGARVGIFNVGGEGQLLLGAIFACQVGVWLDGLSPWIVIPAAALAAMIVGGFYAFIPGVLKVKVKVNEVITTIMLNTIAAYLCQYLAKGPWKNANNMSFIQSNYKDFGSGIVLPGYGLNLNCRAAGFSLDPASDDFLLPRKKPYHTIIPGFLTKDGKAVGPFGVMGAYMQPQGHVQVVMNTVDFLLNPQASLDAPRWQWIEGKKIWLEDRVPAEIVEDLRRRGHEITIKSDYTSFGRGEIIWRDDNGVLAGATEPRADGTVAAW